MFKVLTKGCEPTRGSKYSACVDLYAAEDVVIGAGETKLIGLGVAIYHDSEGWQEQLVGRYIRENDILVGYEYKDVLDAVFSTNYLQLMLHSSLCKKGLIIPNGVGIIDLDYKDEINMIIHNPLYDTKSITTDDFNTSYHIKKGDKIAQITLLEHKSYIFGIDTDKERDGGFGSTGK